MPFYSPQIAKIEVSKSGDVRRSKLYYLRNRSGKSARISEKNRFNQAKQSSPVEKIDKISEKKDLKGSEFKDNKKLEKAAPK